MKTCWALVVGALIFAAVAAGTIGAQSATAAPPANDNLAAAQVLSGGLPIAVSGSNVEATSEKDAGEPGSPLAHSVWYSWTPTAETEGQVSLKVCPDYYFGTPWNGSASVYSGAGYGSLANVVTVAWRCHRPKFNAEAGETYWIRVDVDWDYEFEEDTWTMIGQTGDFVIDIAKVQPPANDNFADAEVLTGTLPIAVPGTNYDATHQYAQDEQGYFDSATVWYSWTPTGQTAGLVQLEVCRPLHSPWHGIVEVSTGDTLGSLQTVGSAWGCDPLVFTGEEGTTYFIRVNDGWWFDTGIDWWAWDGAVGDFELSIASDETPGPPSNAFTLSKPKLKKNGTAVITAAIPGPGRIEILGSKTVQKANKIAAAGPANLKLTIKAKGKAAKKLRKKGKVKIKAQVRFTPEGAGGAAKTLTKTVTLKRSA